MSGAITTSWHDTFTLSCALQGIFLLLLLFVNKYPASRGLALMVLGSIGGTVATALFPVLTDELIISLCLFESISIYWYVQMFFSQRTRISVRPFIALLAAAPVFTGQYEFVHHITRWIIIPVLVLTFLWMAGLELKKEGRIRGFSWFVNPGSRLTWIRNFYLFHILFMAGGFLISSHILPVPTYALLTLIQLYFIYFQFFRESDFLSPIPPGTKYQKSTLTPAQKSSILHKLEALISTEKFYLDSTVSLAGLAEKLQTTSHHLSQVLNEARKQSFQELLTQYRIREARILLKSEAHKNTKIESIAMMVGYNSKSSFNTAFKRATSLTPKEFKAAKNVRPYGDERPPDRKNTFLNVYKLDLMHGITSNILRIMISNFWKVFYRRTSRNKLFSIINLFGLTVGFICCILIYLFINKHLSYDTQLPHSEQIYRIVWENDNPQTRTPHPMAQAMKDDFPEVIAATTISPMYGAGLTRQALRVENLKKNIRFIETDFLYVDSTFTDVFELKILAGDPDALKKPWNIVIPESTAKKYFGEEDPIGQELTVDDWSVEVAAVIEDMPEKSHFHFTGLISYVTIKTIDPDNLWYTWLDFGHFNYIKTTREVDYRALESKIPEWVISYLDWNESHKESLLNREMGFRLQPIQDIHLTSHLRWELENNANILYIYILAGTLLFVLVIVCINYINLTTAKSIERAREVGIRKTLGALSSGLTIQFYLESLIFCLIAVLLAFGITFTLLPLFNHLTQITFTVSDLIQPDFLLTIGVAVLAMSLVSGLYPAFVMDRFQPVEVLKGKLTTSFHGKRLRNGLVVFQFFVSAILIIASLIIFKQLTYMKTKALGFDQDALISIRMYPSVETGGMDVEKVKVLENSFLNVPGVKSVSAISNLPGGQFDQLTIFKTDNPTERIDASEMSIDYEGLETLDISLLEGRTFQRSFDSDSSGQNLIINEQAARRLNLTDPIGTSITWEQGGRTGRGTIIGVTKDFHYQSLHEEIQPLIISLDIHDINHVIVKMEGQHFQNTLTQLNQVYDAQGIVVPFDYHFLDSQLAELYDDEVRTLNIFTIFAFIALFLACMGLVGLAIAILNQSIREIGIRKIMGARSWNIFVMIAGQFIKLIAIALALGLPAGYMLMQVWIQEFSYQTSIGIYPFVIASFMLLVVAIMSVSMIILKIANTNPAETLRYE